MIRRARSTSVLAIALAGILSLIGSTQTWIHIALVDGASADIPVAGADALPVLAPLCLAVMALGLALSIVGKILRILFGAVTVAIAVALATIILPVLAGPPLASVGPAITTATGISGDASLEALIASLTLTTWPAITLFLTVVLGLAGVFVVVTGWRWPSGGRKYQAAAAARRAARSDDTPLDAVDSWDDLSRGDDPTSPEVPR